MGESFLYLLTESELVKLNEYLLSQSVTGATNLNKMIDDEIETIKWDMSYIYHFAVISSEMGTTWGVALNGRDLNNSSWSLANEELKQICTNYRFTCVKVSYEVDESPNKNKVYTYETLMIPTALLDFLKHKKIID